MSRGKDGTCLEAERTDVDETGRRCHVEQVIPERSSVVANASYRPRGLLVTGVVAERVHSVQMRIEGRKELITVLVTRRRGIDLGFFGHVFFLRPNLVCVTARDERGRTIDTQPADIIGDPDITIDSSRGCSLR